jgi:hypothetical protein
VTQGPRLYLQGELKVLSWGVLMEFVKEEEDILRYIPESIPEEEARDIAKEAFVRAQAQIGVFPPQVVEDS